MDVPTSRALPTWAPKGAVNGRGILKINPTHYFAVVMLGSAVTEAIVDTGGARTMIDAQLAKQL